MQAFLAAMRERLRLRAELRVACHTNLEAPRLEHLDPSETANMEVVDIMLWFGIPYVIS